MELLLPGQGVYAESRDDFEPALVLDHVAMEDAVGYLIQFTDGTEDRYAVLSW